MVGRESVDCVDGADSGAVDKEDNNKRLDDKKQSPATQFCVSVCCNSCNVDDVGDDDDKDDNNADKHDDNDNDDDYLPLCAASVSIAPVAFRGLAREAKPVLRLL